MESQFNVLFWLRTTQKNRDGLCGIYMRITINGERFQPGTQKFISKKHWHDKAGLVRHDTPQANEINDFLQILKHRAFKYQREILLDNLELNVENFRKRWLGIGEKQYMILEVFAEHNEKVKQLVGKDFAEGTLERYITSLEHTSRFIQLQRPMKVTRLNRSKLTTFFAGEDSMFIATQEVDFSHNVCC